MRRKTLFSATGSCILALAASVLAERASAHGPATVKSSESGEGSSRNPGKSTAQDVTALFAKGQRALQTGDLAEAEADFRGVLAVDPNAGAAYANLGVIAMRRKEWEHALSLLEKAEKLEPKMAGVRLNIGLVQYRRGNYEEAVGPLSSVVKEQPDSDQARYLLGLCEVFTSRFREAVATLEPMWPKMSGDVMYLYVLELAAQNSKQTELDEKVMAQMIVAGKAAPEFHLILAKAYLNRQESDKAFAELESAATANPNLPYLHFNWGIAYMRANEDEKAEAEFKRDIAIEPDLPDNYEQLGLLYARMQRDGEAEKSFHAAIERDGKLTNSLVGLAKLYLKQKKYKQALETIDVALRISPKTESAHFLRGRTLMQLGRQEEGRAEMEKAKKLLDSGLEKDRDTMEQNAMPIPELTREPK
jgi:tetratricopeptide (TPR) repeat protein